LNKEHFLIELKICLKPIAPEEQAIILEQYNIIFNERIAEGETEEQIAKSLGKPRTIANEILKEHNIIIPEKKVPDDGWREIAPEYMAEIDDFEEHIPHEPVYRQRSFFNRFLQIIGILCLNGFLMFWVFLTIALVLFACALAGSATLLSPIIGIYGVIAYFGNAALFQLFSTIFLFGASIIGWLLFIPIVKVFIKIFSYYLRWNIAVLRGEV
jgi:uncharacterized membrane protein